jgi:hypothetical protein
MAFTKDDKEKLDAVFTGLVGVGGKGGLIDRFEKLASSHYSLKRKVYVAFGVVAAAYGGISAFVAKLFNGG